MGQIGKKYIVQDLTRNALTSRLLTRGLKLGSEVTIVNKSIFGNSFHVKIEDNKFIALRKEELLAIEISTYE